MHKNITDTYETIDIHSHLLPGIDDGAVDWTDSLNMLRVAVDAGTSVIAATSHVPHGWRGARPPHEVAPRLVAELNQRAQEAGLPITVVPGMEIYLEPETATRLEEGTLLTLNGSRYALIEVGFTHWTTGTELCLQAVLDAGFVPVLAHPERNRRLQRRPELLRPFVEQGALGQVNAGSLIGAFGQGSKRTAGVLFERGLAHIIASDAHSVESRPPDLTRPREILAARYGEAFAIRATHTVAAAILRDDVVSTPESVIAATGT